MKPYAIKAIFTIILFYSLEFIQQNVEYHNWVSFSSTVLITEIFQYLFFACRVIFLYFMIRIYYLVRFETVNIKSYVIKSVVFLSLFILFRDSALLAYLYRHKYSLGWYDELYFIGAWTSISCLLISFYYLVRILFLIVKKAYILIKSR